MTLVTMQQKLNMSKPAKAKPTTAPQSGALTDFPGFHDKPKHQGGRKLEYPEKTHHTVSCIQTNKTQ